MVGRSLLALSIVTVVRLVVAGCVPLSPDEAYYWVWSRALAPGYLDHPPMVALWIWAGTALVGEHALGVRLLAPLAAAGGSVLLAAAGARLFGDWRRGIWAAVLLNATPMFGVGAVTMTPDTPLLFFWTAALWALARLVPRDGDGGGGAWWLVVGAAAGLGLDSKYTAALLGVGIGAWLLTPGMRPALSTVWPWLGGLVALLLTGPVVAWNAGHGWASFAKQGGRAGDWHPALRYLGELVGGQAGLASPVIAGLMVVGVVAAARRWREKAPALLAALTVPGAAVFLEHAVGDRVQANWVAVLYPAAALCAAALCAAGVGLRWRAWGAGLGFALTAALYVQASLAPLALPRAVDPTLRLAGFDGLAAAAGAAAEDAHLGAVASEEYGLAALLAWHGTVPVVGNEARWRFFALPGAAAGPWLLVLSERRSGGPDMALWESAVPAGSLERRRGGTVAETYRLYRVVARAGAAAVALPGRVDVGRVDGGRVDGGR